MVKIGVTPQALYMTVSLLLATLNCHTSALFEGKAIKLLGYPRRYKYYANALQCYFTSILSLLFFIKYLIIFDNLV